MALDLLCMAAVGCITNSAEMAAALLKLETDKIKVVPPPWQEIIE